MHGEFDDQLSTKRAEKDLRMAKVKQKSSGCFRKGEYTRAECRMSSSSRFSWLWLEKLLRLKWAGVRSDKNLLKASSRNMNVCLR